MSGSVSMRWVGRLQVVTLNRSEIVSEALEMNFFDIDVRSLEGEADLLGPQRGKVVLAVNVASRCGLTPQYEQLEVLHRELDGQGFTVIGFPCNQFGAQ